MSVLITFAMCLPCTASAQNAIEPQAQMVNLSGTMSIDEAIKAIAEQTGNRLVDQRLQKMNLSLNLTLEKVPYWQALDAIAKEANVSFSPYRVEGATAIIDGPYRPAPVSYDGLFRMAVKGVNLHQDFETNTRTCTTQIEIAWEPRFQPFYMDVGSTGFVFAADAAGKKLRVDAPGTGKQSVAQRGAVELAVQTTAPARSAREIESIQGKLSFVVPSKMLAFKFNSLKPMKNAPGYSQMQDGVTVRLTQITAAADRWSIDVAIQNPPGGPEFESFQHWLHNNQILLEKGKQIFRPDPADEQQLDIITAERAAIRYHFNHRGRTAEQLGQLGDWTLIYHTPGRIVEVPATFEFKGVALP